MSNGNGIKDVVVASFRQLSGEPELEPKDDDPVVKYLADVFDVCELSMLLEEKFPDSKGQIERVMVCLGANKGMTEYCPENATLHIFEDLYAALDGVR